MLSVSQSFEYTPRILLRRCVEEAEKCISSLQEALAAATLCINRRSTPSESIWDEPKGNRYLSEQRIDTSQSLSVAEIQPMSQSAPPPQTLPLLRGGVLDPVSIVVRTKGPLAGRGSAVKVVATEISFSPPSVSIPRWRSDSAPLAISAM